MPCRRSSLARRAALVNRWSSLRCSVNLNFGRYFDPLIDDLLMPLLPMSLPVQMLPHIFFTPGIPVKLFPQSPQYISYQGWPTPLRMPSLHICHCKRMNKWIHFRMRGRTIIGRNLTGSHSYNNIAYPGQGRFQGDTRSSDRKCYTTDIIEGETRLDKQLTRWANERKT